MSCDWEVGILVAVVLVLGTVIGVMVYIWDNW